MAGSDTGTSGAATGDVVRVPATIDEVDPSWLTDVLRAAGTISDADAVTAAEISQIGVGVGVMGELYSARLTYAVGSAGAPSVVIVKLPSRAEENRAQGIGLGLYDAEVRFYAELAARTDARTPHCYFSRIVGDDGQFALVLEDLSHLSVADEVAGVSLPRATAAVGALARLHGSWWGRVDADELAWISALWSPRIEGFAQVYPSLWAPFVEKFADALPVGAIEAGERITARYAEIMQTLGSQTKTLLHMDFRCDNMFFADDRSGEPDSVTVIDWQSLGRGAGVYDLAYFLSGSLEVADRRVHERALVAEYGRVLAASGGPQLEPDRLWADYVYAGMTSVAVPVLTGASFDLANERGAQLIRGMAARMFTAVVDHDATAMLGP